MVSISVSGTPAAPGTTVDVVYDCPVTVGLNDLVYFDATANQVDKADNSSITTGRAIGFVSGKPSATKAVVRTSTNMTGLSGIVSGAPYYLSTNGGFTITPPDPNVPSDTGKVVQVIGIGSNATTILIDPEINIIVI